MRATEIFVREFMFKFHTRKIGRMPSVQSAAALSALCAYVESAMISLEIHDAPSTGGVPPKGDCVQK
jgi:hypothetical protein